MYRFCEHNCSQARCMMDVNWISQTYYYMDTQLNVTQDNDKARWTGPKQNECWISHDAPNIMLHGDTVWVLHNEQRWESTQNKMHDRYHMNIPNTTLFNGDSFNSAKICCNFAYRSGLANIYCCILRSPYSSANRRITWMYIITTVQVDLTSPQYYNSAVTVYYWK